MAWVRFLMTLWNMNLARTLRKLADIIEGYPEFNNSADSDISEYGLNKIIKTIYGKEKELSTR